MKNGELTKPLSKLGDLSQEQSNLPVHTYNLRIRAQHDQQAKKKASTKYWPSITMCDNDAFSDDDYRRYTRLTAVYNKDITGDYDGE